MDGGTNASNDSGVFCKGTLTGFTPSTTWTRYAMTIESISGSSAYARADTNTTIVVPKKGTYIITLHIDWSGVSSKEVGILIYTNGNELATDREMQTGDCNVNLTAMDYLNAGDKVQARVLVASTGPVVNGGVLTVAYLGEGIN